MGASLTEMGFPLTHLVIWGGPQALEVQGLIDQRSRAGCFNKLILVQCSTL